jgi:pimeloyl-ACP methyl ester carboxylesterase
MGWVDGDVTLNGTRLHYYRRGDGPPLLLAHGATDNGRCWTRVAEKLEGDFDIIAYDARNHGKSEGGTVEASDAAHDLIGVAEALGLERPAAMGHSMGGMALTQALSLRPDLFRAAVLEDPPWRIKLPLTKPGETLRFNPMDWLQNQNRSVEELMQLGKEESPTWHEDEFRDWAEAKLQFRPNESWLDAIRRKGMPPWEEFLKEVGCPVLLACGTQEKMAIVTPETAADAQALCPILEVAVFDAGHNVRREAFDDYVTTVSEFLRRYDPRGSSADTRPTSKESTTTRTRAEHCAPPMP